MKITAHLLLLVFLIVSAGCANMSQRTKCICKSATAGALVGAGVGGAAGSASSSSNEGQQAGIGGYRVNRQGRLQAGQFVNASQFTNGHLP